MPTTKGINWDEAATAAANYIGNEMFEAHRGALPWREVGVVALFANDGFSTDVRSKLEAEFVRRAVELEGGRVLGFGVDAESGYTWVLLTTGIDVELLNHLVWMAWDSACYDVPAEDREGLLASPAMLEVIASIVMTSALAAGPGRMTGMQGDIATRTIAECAPPVLVSAN